MGADRKTGGREARLAEFLAQSRWEALPETVRRHARLGILNVAGCIVAGRDDPAVRLLKNLDDAVVDAAAATAHDYDDTHLPTVIHATPPVAGALFSLTRKQAVSGRELLHAFALGMETSCRLGNAVSPGHYERGWHITSTCGVFGAAAAAGKVVGLNEKQLAHAFGIAATQAAGLVEVLGSMARVLNAGFAARNGLQAALLAAQGFEGPARPLEGLRGFFNVLAGTGKPERLTDGLGEQWPMLEVAYKPYPCGVVLHALIDGCLHARERLRRAPEIVVALNPLAVERADRPEPGNAIEARLSAQHAVAVAALRGRAGLGEFSDEAAVDGELREFRRRVRVAADANLDKMAARIKAGDATIDAPAARLLDAPRIEAKLRELAGPAADDWLRFAASLDSSETVSLPRS